ncbi:MAG: response regulator [Lachnospiraceae bacterium]|nr:response regulator [Lachnospiraceae bacterium]
MPSKITVISKGTAFMTNALAKNLEEDGFAVSVIEPGIETINLHRRDTDIFLIYAGNFISDTADFFVYLKDICSEDEKMICVIGHPHEIEDIRNLVSDKLITRAFERPFDMKDLIADIGKLCKADDERKKGKHILLIDDDLTYLKTVQGWLSDKYRVTIARSGMQAITYIATHIPDLILLDYEMPITTGPQVMEMIRSEPASSDIPIIFLTGKSDKASVITVMAMKPQGYMLKTMTKEQILETIDNFFETRKWKIS